VTNHLKAYNQWNNIFLYKRIHDFASKAMRPIIRGLSPLTNQ